jgi:hypothetical protein
MLEYLNWLSFCDMLGRGVREGVIVPSVKNSYDIYLSVTKRMESNGGNKTAAVQDEADERNVTTKTIWQALSKFSC